jgi:hypothetical protein
MREITPEKLGIQGSGIQQSLAVPMSYVAVSPLASLPGKPSDQVMI